MTQLISFSNNTFNQSYKIISEKTNAETKGVFDEDFFMMKNVATRNNLTEEEAINLIDSIRDELSMNQ